MSLNDLSRKLCDRLGWNMFEIEVEITWRTLQTKRTTQVSQIAGPSRFGGNVNRQVSVQEIVNMKPLLGMTFAPYCYGGFEPSDDEDEHHINRVVLMGKMRMIEMIRTLS
uniref:Uncharacterized protein n=1 Tax=Populus trichocarpa TaxID=3694 RepID=B9ND13_POPTR